MYITTFCEVKIIRQGSIFLLCDFEPFQFKSKIISILDYFAFKLMAYLFFLSEKRDDWLSLLPKCKSNCLEN